MADGWKRKMISFLNEIFVVLISVLIFLFQFLFCSILERKDDKSIKRDMIVLTSFPILFVSICFLVNIGKDRGSVCTWVKTNMLFDLLRLFVEVYFK